MFIKGKSLQSKCRACGTINNLDSTHRSGIQLMKQLPKNMSEIDGSKNDAESQGDGKKQKKVKDEEQKIEEEPSKKKKKAEEEQLTSVPEAATIDSEEVCKYIKIISYFNDDLMMNTLSLPLKSN